MGVAYLYGNGGGSATSQVGGALVVTAPAGASVTVSKDDKTYTKSAGSSGSATFKGLSSGTWSITISNGSQTATKTIGISVDYAITLAFFAATISVTYPSGSTCTATDGTTTLTAPDTSGTWSCVVPNAGTWTIAISSGSGSSNSKDVVIETDGQSETVSISYIYWILNGSETADYTGGWTKGGNAAAGTTSEKDGIYLKTTSSASGSYRMKTGISDFTKYSSLKITQTTKVNGHQFRLTDSSGNTLVEASTYTNTSPVVIDLSGLNLSSDKLYRFGIYGGAVGGTSGASTKVTHIWLE